VFIQFNLNTIVISDRLALSQKKEKRSQMWPSFLIRWAKLHSYAWNSRVCWWYFTHHCKHFARSGPSI